MLVNLQQVLKKAQEGHYAVGLFNTIDTDMLEAVISAAEELNSPVIIGTAEVLLPYGELRLITPSLIAAAQRATVPVVLHYDHGLTFERCMAALRLGFTSIMFDGSSKDPRKNMEETACIVKIAHAFGATVEGEIGHIGQAADYGIGAVDRYTTADEAVEFISKTGVDALAVAIGTAHGAYSYKPCLDLNRLRAIREVVNTPLVLHGGSGLSNDDFRNVIRDGIQKINIFTDLCAAASGAAAEAVYQKLDYLRARSLKVERMKEAAKEKMRIFGSVDKA